VYWNWDSATIDIADVPSRAFDTEEQYMRTAALLSHYNEDTSATPSLDAAFNSLAKERIEDDPMRYYVALPVARFADMILRPRTEMMEIDLEWWRWRKHPRQTIFAAGYALLNLVYFGLGLWGLWRWRRKGWDAPLAWSMIAFVVLRSAMLFTLDNPEPRYTLEFFPLLLVWAGALVPGSRPFASSTGRFNSGAKSGILVRDNDLSSSEQPRVQ
jgi:hypothetical protein